MGAAWLESGLSGALFCEEPSGVLERRLWLEEALLVIGGLVVSGGMLFKMVSGGKGCNVVGEGAFWPETDTACSVGAGWVLDTKTCG